ncbi:MAG: aminoacetone oxidase family FAD-binding enzyme [Geothrix sp.]|uniref:NAD(P)/FAD-dependent oxidoreductase n=1 Tax=Geothrix sp. TaxID=1962974 RepID=UPI0017F6E6E9|nr:aminoacetone oxidase family FAD-binding enzyme [Geothrix sp.]NWJ39437.1 aminoacetone oxidase family FAD-binding enzyme [Geothrix sp.]WIL19338.1 MAG: NAD(P)/FAD-dependent oxidoreductase [Geothrix sp.]
MAKVIVVGGGAAGLVAAWRAASLGHQVRLLEANGRLGVKLRISGGGKCNITHDGSPRSLLEAFSKSQARFLRPSLLAFDNQAVLELLHREGVETYSRDNGRIFPADRPGSAGAVVAAFEMLVRRAGVDVHTGARVTALRGQSPRLDGLVLDGAPIAGEVFILATGGASYPETGTRGEVLGWLRGLGVPVRPWFPALAPIPLQRPRPAWEGVSLRDGELRLTAGPEGRRLSAFRGDVVFTKAGISGPAALELSQATEQARREGAAWLSYASILQPAETVDAAVLEEQRANPRLLAATWLQRHLPERLVAPLLQEAGLERTLMLKDLPKAGRKALVALVTALPLGEPQPVPLARGEVAAGGVDLAAVDPRTMALRGWENLRVCGELLDVDGPVGGYNLQAAFSTGFAAGSI